MSKDDYFPMVYRILSYLYECFKAGEKPDLSMIDPDALKINAGYWNNIIESLSNEEYVTGISFPSAIGGMMGAKIYNLKITQKGIEFLQENTMMQKAKRFLKEAKDVIPGI